jgi:hypothetical protein
MTGFPCTPRSRGVRAIAAIDAGDRCAAIQTEREPGLAIAGGPGYHRDRVGHSERQGADRKLDMSIHSARRLVETNGVHIDSVARSVDALRNCSGSTGTPETEGGSNGTAHHYQDGHVDAKSLSK